MKLSKELLERGFEFYNVDDEELRRGCLAALDAVLADDAKRESVERVGTDIFSHTGENVSQHLQKETIEALFGFNIPYVSQLLLLSGADVHRHYFETLPYEKEQMDFQKNLIRSTCIAGKKNEPIPNIGVVALVWKAYFSSNRLIQVGRLQFGPTKGTVKIHIPRSKSLDMNEVLASIRASLDQVKKVFCDENPVYKCSSWLLSPELKLFLKEGSNILKFQSLFTIEERTDCLGSLKMFLYQVPKATPVEEFAENTSLQRAVKAYLLEGNVMHSGLGTLKPEVFDPSFKI